MDDVDSTTQLKLLEPQSFGINSHVIITTRDRGVMNSIGNRNIVNIYDVDFMQMDDAKKLFCQHAGIEQIRGDALQTNKVKEKVEAVVERCGGLPLTLEVMGSYLRNYAPDSVYWEQTVEKLRTGQSISGGGNDDVWASLKISYDALAEEEKEMFTEAATLFFEEPLDRALAAWSGAYGNSETRWANLVRRSLAKEVTVTRERFGRRKSVWVHEQLRGLATSFNKGNKVDKRISATSEIVDLLNAEKVKAEAKFLRLGPSYFGWNTPSIQVDQLANLTRLKYLELENFKLEGSGDKFPRELFILSLKGWIRGLRISPIKLQERNNLAVLEMKDLYIPRKFVEELGNLDKLRILSLKDVKVINTFRIFSLDFYIPFETPPGTIRRLPETFGNLSQLTDLELVGIELEELPESFGKLSALEQLTLVGVKCLKLPKSFVELTALQSLTISSDSLGALPEDIGRLSSLRELHLSVKPIKNLPTSFGLLFALQSLTIRCNYLKKLPDSFGDLSSLEELMIDAKRLQTLPENFARLNSLKRLKLFLEVSDLPNNFGELSTMQGLALYCPNLVKLPESFGNLSSLKSFTIDVRSLKCFPESVGQLSSLRTLNFNCDGIERMPDGLAHLSFFSHTLTLTGDETRILPGGLGALSSLRTLFLVSLSSLQSLPEELGELSSLETLDISDCHNLQSLAGSLARISSLKDVHLTSCEKLKNLPTSWGKPSSLTQLTLPLGDGRQDLTRSAVEESSSTTTDTDGLRIHLMGCGSLNESLKTNSGWLLEQHARAFRTTYRRKWPDCCG